MCITRLYVEAFCACTSVIKQELLTFSSITNYVDNGAILISNSNLKFLEGSGHIAVNCILTVEAILPSPFMCAQIGAFATIQIVVPWYSE